MNIALWTLQALLAAVFTSAGVHKTILYEKTLASTPGMQDVPPLLMHTIGILEFAGVLGLLLPMLTGVKPALTPLAAAALAVLTVLATLFHLRRGENAMAAFPLVVAILCTLVALGRWPLLGR